VSSLTGTGNPVSGYIFGLSDRPAGYRVYLCCKKVCMKCIKVAEKRQKQENVKKKNIFFTRAVGIDCQEEK
jgi:hypothetical protein